MKRYLLLLLAPAILLINACDISDNDALPKESFLKIYDDDSFEASFIPIDVKETSKGDFIVLGATRLEESDFTGIFLIKTDSDGQFITQLDLSSDLIHPIGDLIEIDNKFYFAAMNNISWQANIIEVSTDSLTINSSPIGGLSYPLHLKQEGNELILLSYDNDDKNSVISVIDQTGAVINSQALTIGAGADVEAPIIEHFTRSGRQLPFFVGKTEGIYFFNGFFNYTLSLVFTDLNGDGEDGVLQGQRDDGGISAALHLDGSRFAFSRFNFGDNYLLPASNVEVFGTTSSTDMEGNPFPELIPNAPVVIKSVEINGDQVTLYASNTKGGQIVLLAYNNNGDLLGSKYIGFSTPYEISGFTQTADGGLAITGTVYVAGRFARVFLNKLSKEELTEII
ncbi:MAG: hypothetical protein ABJH05_07075 [Fulvivirga sp.]